VTVWPKADCPETEDVERKAVELVAAGVAVEPRRPAWSLQRRPGGGAALRLARVTTAPNPARSIFRERVIVQLLSG